jgi:hypothetical protein
MTKATEQENQDMIAARTQTAVNLAVILAMTPFVVWFFVALPAGYDPGTLTVAVIVVIAPWVIPAAISGALEGMSRQAEIRADIAKRIKRESRQ